MTSQHAYSTEHFAPSSWPHTIERLRRRAGQLLDEHSEDRLPDLLQTHISVVLLGDQLVLKLKKPVNFGFLDYTSLEQRRRACEAEVELNRRLCPDAYLGVQPISEQDGHLHFDGAGHIIDYGVMMKRLPIEGMLDFRIAQGSVTEAMISQVAARLAQFHHHARRGSDVDVFASVQAIRRNWSENFSQIEPYIGRTINSADFEYIRNWIEAWLTRHEELLHSRVHDGRICDGHGDVRCESICLIDATCSCHAHLSDTLYIFDCIEFNERFRCGDVAGEVAFLAVDLDARGRPDLSYYFTERYAEYSGDQHLFSLLPFYRCYRAFVRGKVLSFRLNEPEFSESERANAAARAKEFFALAKHYATPLRQPTVVAISGLSGSGKTAVARSIAGELGVRVVSSDTVRSSLFGDICRPQGYGQGPYSSEGNERTYESLLQTGLACLEEDGAVVLDATFRRAADRDAALAMAEKAGANWRLIECVLPPSVAHERLSRRTITGDSLSAASWVTYQKQQQEFEPVIDTGNLHHLILDTRNDFVYNTRTASEWLRTMENALVHG